MAQENSFLIALSLLNRNVQKYFDRALEPYGIGYSQFLYLVLINENEGITMQEAARSGEVDKGTTTKSIQKLIDQEYIVQLVDEKDRRVKRLYTTKNATALINELYDLRNTCRKLLATDLDFSQFETLLAEVCDNSRKHLEEPLAYEALRIGGLQKFTLLDYPGKAACTIFTLGCNFKCPFCHNKDLVFVPEGYQPIDPQEILNFLEKRQGVLEAVCFSGGEPLTQAGLPEFLKRIKALGYQIKIDTNGSQPELLAQLVEEGLVDYVAMDLKNDASRYEQTSGLNMGTLDHSQIQATIDYLLSGAVDYEFRTTIVKEYHDAQAMKEMALRIQGAKRYFLQQFQESGNCISPGLHACTHEEMKQFLQIVQQIIPQAQLRGIKEEHPCIES